MLTAIACGAVCGLLYCAVFSTEILETIEADETTRAMNDLRKSEISASITRAAEHMEYVNRWADEYRRIELTRLAERERRAQRMLDLVLPL